ncbi:hypothetical protein JHK87_012388 [Glycine soja]|nr:hypothetical protein JHK87_012388 [Glycine soja]
MQKSDDKDYGLEALEEIMSIMDSGKIVVIFAGYCEPMKRVIASNEGFCRRMTKFFQFNDFNSEELAQILHIKMNNLAEDSLLYGFMLHPDCCIKVVAALIERETTEKQRKETNRGLVDTMLVNARENLDLRLSFDCMDTKELLTITLVDLEAGLLQLTQQWHYIENCQVVVRRTYNIPQEDPEVAKFREQGLKFLHEMEFLSKGTIATGFAAYAPSEDSRQYEGFNTRTEETNDNINDNIDDNTDMEVNEPEIDTTTQNMSSAKENGQRKRGREGDKRIWVAAKLSSQLDCIIQTFESSVSAQDPTSITACVAKLKDLLGLERGSELFYKATKLMKKRANRITFVVLEEPELQLGWIKMSSSLSSNDSSLSSNDSSFGDDDHITKNKVLMFALANVTNYFMNYVVKNPCRDSSMTGYPWVSEILNGHPIRCYQMFRIKKLVFLELCDILETKCNLKKTRNVNIYEQVGLFLYMLSQPGSIRNCEERFQHSGETISRHFHNVLEAVCMFAKDIIKLVDPSFRDTPDEILKDARYCPYFRDCIGAIDVTHIRVCVPSHLQGVYIGRKGYTTTNVMVVCDFSMCFTFVWAGWEGSALDTKIFMEVLRKPALHFPHPPKGKYYLVDSGYSTFMGFLGPYKKTRFNISVPGFRLVQRFDARNDTENNVEPVTEFFMEITSPTFKIIFRPLPSSFAFVNAIELFLLPLNLISNNVSHFTFSGYIGLTSYRPGLYSRVLETKLRLNVGGQIVTGPDNLLRKWFPDDSYFANPENAKNRSPFMGRIEYHVGDDSDGPYANKFTAPSDVYKTAKEINSSSSNAENITWALLVDYNTDHLLRLQFCDYWSPRSVLTYFYLSIYDAYVMPVNIDNPDVSKELPAPYYYDFLVHSDDSGFMKVSIAPDASARIRDAFLNGLEIMKIIERSSSVPPYLGEPNSEHNRLPMVLGSILGGSVLIMFMMILGFLWRLKITKEKPTENSDWLPMLVTAGGSSQSRLTEGTSQGSALPNINLGLKIPLLDLQLATNNFHAIAVKRGEPGSGEGLLEFHTEIVILSKIHHKHLVSLIGYCDENFEMILVYEYMEKGTLRDHLSNKNLPRLSWKNWLEICIGAASGLHYLHKGADGGIIHRDVKSTNILLDENLVAKLADFGLSRTGPVDHQPYVTTVVKGTFGYLDPEYFKTQQLTEKSDVYSFGVVLLGVLCARAVIDPSLPRDQINLAEWGILCKNKGMLQDIVDPSI